MGRSEDIRCSTCQPQIVDALASAGYDTCSTASNHSLDRGYDGIVRTLDKLDARRIGHTGTFRTVEESRIPRIIDVHGVRVGHISWTYGLNGIPKPAGREWSVNVFNATAADISGILTEARMARAAGADVVVASVHCCVEYTTDPTAPQLEVARRLLAAPEIDLVLGHHAHVVQPFERIGDKWVAYGLGNHLAEQGAGKTEDSVIARFTFTRGLDGRYRADRAEAIPTHIELGPGGVRVVNTAAHRAAYAGSYQRTVEVLNRRGAAAAGLVIAEN